MKPTDKDVPPILSEALERAPTKPELDAVVSLLSAGEAAPSPELRARLLASVASAPERHAPFFDRLGALLDVGAERLREIFAEALDPERWERPGLPGLSLFHFQAGPSLAGADTGLVRLEPGTEFPEHRHLGKEQVLVLEGGYRADDGKLYLAGDSHEMPAQSSHSYTVLPDGPCLFCVVLENGIEIDGVRFG